MIDGMGVLENPVLAGIGKRYGKSSEQVVLAWLLQRGIVVIPKSVTAERIGANIDVAFELSVEEMSAVGNLDKQFRNGWGGPLVERDGEMQPRDLEHPLYVSLLIWASTNEISFVFGLLSLFTSAPATCLHARSRTENCFFVRVFEGASASFVA
eukprot:COSAG02_NODE_733_length_17960_cov_122.222440_5_plen_154_part_00